MTQQLLVLDGDLVVNVILVDEDDDFELDGFDLLADPGGGVGIDWTRDGDDWIPPDPPGFPPTVEQLKAANDELQAQVDELTDLMLEVLG